MNKLYVTSFGDTHAFSTINALVTAYRKGENFVSSLEYPWIGMALNTCNLLHSYNKIITREVPKKEVVGYNMVVDLAGNILDKTPIEKRFTLYYFDPCKVAKIAEDLKDDFNQTALRRNIERMNSLLG